MKTIKFFILFFCLGLFHSPCAFSDERNEKRSSQEKENEPSSIKQEDKVRPRRFSERRMLEKSDQNDQTDRIPSPRSIPRQPLQENPMEVRPPSRSINRGDEAIRRDVRTFDHQTPETTTPQRKIRSEFPHSQKSTEELKRRPDRQRILNTPQEDQRVEFRNRVKKQLEGSTQRITPRQIPRENQEEFKRKFSERREENRRITQDVRKRFNERYPHHKNWFNRQFFNRYDYDPYYYHSGVNWWRPRGWKQVNGWLGGYWSAPIYYTFDGEAYISSPDYYDYYQDQGVTYYDESPIQGDWMPMGVFVLAENVSQASFSSAFIELAISKSGEIAGTYYNAEADRMHSLEGVVAVETQEAAWMISGDPSATLMTTGVFNLTQDVAPLQIHFVNGNVQSWVLISVND